MSFSRGILTLRHRFPLAGKSSHVFGILTGQDNVTPENGLTASARRTIAWRAVYSPGRANQRIGVSHLILRSEMHSDVEQILFSIGDEDILGALRIGCTDGIGTFPELETLGAADGEGCEGQDERRNGGVHEMEGGK